MFDFAWTEIALIAVVALIAIGPKDLPVAIKAVTEMIKKARRMAAEFQTHVDDLVREANLGEVRDQIASIRNFDIKGEVERAVDPDGSLRSTLASNPLAAGSTTTSIGGTTTSDIAHEPSEAAIGEHADTMVQTPGDADPAVDPGPACTKSTAERIPAWVPPGMTLPEPAPEPLPLADAPAYVPPAFAKRHPQP
jgi:sec-independent protein translocase protein TatB